MEEEFNQKVVLVTGGSGLVGNGIKSVSDTFNSIYNKSYKFVYVSSKNYNLEIMSDTIKMFEKIKPTHVIHLAACVGGLFKNMNNKVDMLEKNLMINYNVVKCSHNYNVQKLVACLSTCIFPDKTTYPIDESMLHNGPPHPSNDSYAYAKRMLEVHCRAYRENYGDNFICITPTNIYGPHDNFDIENGHVLPALIHNCYLSKKVGKEFVVRGTGSPLRQFIYSHDLARLILWILDNYCGDNVILSVPEENEISIGDVAKIIARAFDYENNMRFDTNYSDGQYKKTVSAGKILELVGDFEFTSIESGIRETVSWFNKRMDISEK
jgi:GDP-L-fucose synthase